MKRIIGFALVVLTLGLFSCNSTNEENIDIPDLGEELTEKSAKITASEVTVEAATAETDYEVEFYANAELMLTRWWRMGKHFAWNQGLRYHTNHCPEVEITEGETDGYPKTITLDYGDSTVLRNGKVLSGVIEIYITAPRYTQEYSRQVAYMNFGVDSLLVNGTAEVEIDKVDTMFRKIESNLTYILADSTVVNRSSERVWQWIAGLDTEDDQRDDVVIISGGVEATITWTDGTSQSYTKEITTSLKRMAYCRYMVEGVVEVYIDDNLISVLDYGYSESDDDCDQYAKLTTSEGEEIIDLSVRNWRQYQHENQSGK